MFYLLATAADHLHWSNLKSWQGKLENRFVFGALTMKYTVYMLVLNTKGGGTCILLGINMLHAQRW